MFYYNRVYGDNACELGFTSLLLSLRRSITITSAPMRVIRMCGEGGGLCSSSSLSVMFGNHRSRTIRFTIACFRYQKSVRAIPLCDDRWVFRRVFKDTRNNSFIVCICFNQDMINIWTNRNT